MHPDCKTENDAPILVILPFQKWPELELNLHIDALEAVADDLSTCVTRVIFYRTGSLQTKLNAGLSEQ